MLKIPVRKQIYCFCINIMSNSQSRLVTIAYTFNIQVNLMTYNGWHALGFHMFPCSDEILAYK